MDETNAIQEAMNRRGMSMGATQQMTQATPASPQMPQAPQPTDMQAAQAAMPMQGVGQPMQQETPQSDMQIALTALSDLVKSESKLKKDVLQMRMSGAVWVMPNPTNYARSTPSSTGYSKSNPSASNYKQKNLSTGFLLLNTGGYLLLNTGAKIKLHRKETTAINYSSL